MTKLRNRKPEHKTITSASGQPLQPARVPTFTATGFLLLGKPSAYHTPWLQFHDVIVGPVIYRLKVTGSVMIPVMIQQNTELCWQVLYRSVWKLDAAVQASSSVSTRSGMRRHPGPFSVLSSWLSDLSTCAGRHASIFVTTKNVGTPSARAKPRCSLLVPTAIDQKTSQV